MIERGEIFLTKVSLSRNKIAKLCHPFIRDGAVSRPGQGRCCWVLLLQNRRGEESDGGFCTTLFCTASHDKNQSFPRLSKCNVWIFLSWQRILTHAYSRVVLRVLEAAVEAKKRFSVYVTESQPDEAG